MSLINFKTRVGHALENGGRSSVLNSLGWMMFILVGTLMGLVRSGAESWLIILFSVFISLILVWYLGFYFFFALRSPDTLRSEKFSLQKMAIEKGIYGDSESGFIEKSISENALSLPSQSGSEEIKN